MESTSSLLACEQLHFCAGGNAAYERVAWSVYSHLKIHPRLLKRLDKTE